MKGHCFSSKISSDPCIIALITVSSECLNVFEFSECLDGACALIPVFTWVVEAEAGADLKGLAWHHVVWPIILHSSEAMPFTSPSGKSWIPCQEKEGCFGASWQLWGLSRIWPEVLAAPAISCFAGGCLWPPFLDYSKTDRAISTAMIASRLWETDYSQSYLTLLSALENNNNICQCESPVRQWAQSLSVRCGGVSFPAEQVHFWR